MVNPLVLEMVRRVAAVKALLLLLAPPFALPVQVETDRPLPFIIVLLVTSILVVLIWIRRRGLIRIRI